MQVRASARCLLLGVIASGLSACAGGTSLSTDKASATVFRNFLPGTKIVYSANTNGEIAPCGCRSNPTGGIDRRYNLMKMKIPGQTLQLDSGDLLFQSNPVPPFLEKQWVYQGETLIHAYRSLGVEFFTPGELDFGAGRATLETLLKKATFQTLSANLVDAQTKKPIFKEYVVVNKGKIRVGIFGLTGTDINLAPESMGLVVLDPISSAERAITELKKNADIVIAITHQGFEKDRELAEKVDGIDAIFGAHSQSFLHQPEQVKNTLIFQPSFRGQHIGVYDNGDNALYQIDARFDSPSGQNTEMDRLITKAKAEIARLNKESDEELFGTTHKSKTPETKMAAKPRAYRTFVSCVQCHKPQYDFHLATQHQKAFKTLVEKNEDSNRECLQCHTVGAGKLTGWTNVNRLVSGQDGHLINVREFAANHSKNPHQNLSKIRRAYINVQCESCHGPAGDHPKDNVAFEKVNTSTCVQCHTKDRAPGWYQTDGSLNQALVEKKLQSMTCPR